MLFHDLLFWVLATITVSSALGVVLLHNLFRAALLLVLLFLSIAGHFFLLTAEFLGVVQVLIYAGAISILIIFAIMLTQNVQQGNLPNKLQFPVLFVSLALAGILIFVLSNTNWNLVQNLPQGSDILNVAFHNTTDTLAKLLLTNFALPFSTAGVLLLASLIGALSLVREK